MSDTAEPRQMAPAFQMYWRDPLGHQGLQSLSLEHRGLWIELMLRMAGSGEFGVLLINGRPMRDDALARLLHVPPKKLTKLLDELLEAGVFARRDDGAVFSPRMVKDERIRRARAEGGRQSLKHPHVAQPRATRKDYPEGGGEDTREGYPRGGGEDTREGYPRGGPFDPSPSSASAFASASAPTEEKDAHRFHAFCHRNGGWCVPVAVHQELTRKLSPRYHGDGREAGRLLIDWYREVLDRLGPADVIGDAFRFWGDAFDREFTSARA